MSAPDLAEFGFVRGKLESVTTPGRRLSPPTVGDGKGSAMFRSDTGTLIVDAGVLWWLKETGVIARYTACWVDLSGMFNQATKQQVLIYSYCYQLGTIGRQLAAGSFVRGGIPSLILLQTLVRLELIMLIWTFATSIRRLF